MKIIEDICEKVLEEREIQLKEYEKICNVAFNCLGYGFVGRQELINHLIYQAKSERELVEELVNVYNKETYPNEVKPMSDELFKEITDKILESKNDISIFIHWVLDYEKNHKEKV